MSTEAERDIGRLEGKMDLLIDLVKQHLEDDKNTHAAQEKRIAMLEADNNQAKGKASVIGGIVGSIAGAVAAGMIGYAAGRK